MGEINTFLCSDFIPKSNPFEEYFRNIQGKWNEADYGDYIQKFSEYIQVYGQERFELQFKKWMVRGVACCLEDGFFNKQALIFVQEQQNSGKTTLTRFLVPEKLMAYHAENISVDKDSLIALRQNFGIIQDELSTLSRAEINAQKTLMSKSQVKVRHPYDKKPKMEPRRASIPPINRKEIPMSQAVYAGSALRYGKSIGNIRPTSILTGYGPRPTSFINQILYTK